MTVAMLLDRTTCWDTVEKKIARPQVCQDRRMQIRERFFREGVLEQEKRYVRCDSPVLGGFLFLTQVDCSGTTTISYLATQAEKREKLSFPDEPHSPAIT